MISFLTSVQDAAEKSAVASEQATESATELGHGLIKSGLWLAASAQSFRCRRMPSRFMIGSLTGQQIDGS